MGKDNRCLRRNKKRTAKGGGPYDDGSEEYGVHSDEDTEFARKGARRAILIEKIPVKAANPQDLEIKESSKMKEDEQ